MDSFPGHCSQIAEFFCLGNQKNKTKYIKRAGMERDEKKKMVETLEFSVLSPHLNMVHGETESPMFDIFILRASSAVPQFAKD